MILVGIRPDHEFESLIKWDEPIGEGTTRHVFRVVGESGVVIKRSKTPFHQGNHIEWIVWNALTKMAEDIMGNESNPDLKNHFAICHAISHSGQYLMMERLHSAQQSDPGFVRLLPDWLNDKKPSAIGSSASGLPKVMDYANIDFYSVLNPKKRTALF